MVHRHDPWVTPPFITHRSPLPAGPANPPVGMATNNPPITPTGCTFCGRTELSQSGITDSMARFTNADDRTDRCLRKVGIDVIIGTEVRLCRRHAVLLERELTIEYGSACPYVRPLPHRPAAVGVDTSPRMAELTTWTGDPFLPPATLGPEFKLFGRHKARRVSVEFEGRTYSGVWLPDSQDFVRLRAG